MRVYLDSITVSSLAINIGGTPNFVSPVGGRRIDQFIEEGFSNPAADHFNTPDFSRFPVHFDQFLAGGAWGRYNLSARKGYR